MEGGCWYIPRHARQPLLLRPPSPGPRDGPGFRPQRRQTHRPPIRSRQPLPLGQHQADGGAGAVRDPVARRTRRLRDGLLVVHHRHPRAGQGGCESRHHRQRAHHPRHVADHGFRRRRAEAALRAVSRGGQGARRVWSDRARGRIGCGRHQDDRRGPGRPLRLERLENLHHARRRGRDFLRHSTDRPERKTHPWDHRVYRHEGHL